MSTTTDVGEGGTDVYLGSYYRSNALAAGQSYTASATVTIPQTLTPGTYYIIVRADRPSQVPTSNDPTTVRRVYESSYANNDTASAAIPVTAGPAPDLAVTAVSAPPMAIEDQPITVSWTVTNDDASTSAVLERRRLPVAGYALRPHERHLPGLRRRTRGAWPPARATRSRRPSTSPPA